MQCKIYINMAEVDEGNTTIAIFLEFFDFKLSDQLSDKLISNTLKTRIIVEISQGMKYLHSANSFIEI